MTYTTERRAAEERARLTVEARCDQLAHRQPNDEERAQLLADCWTSEGVPIGDLGGALEWLAMDDLISKAMAQNGDPKSADYRQAAFNLGDFIVGLAREHMAPALERYMEQARTDYYASLRQPDPDYVREQREAV